MLLNKDENSSKQEIATVDFIQNPVINNLIALNERKKTNTRSRVLTEYKSGGVTFKVKGTELADPITKQVLLYVILDLTKHLPKGLTDEKASSYLNFDFNLNDYCQVRGLSDRKSAKQQVIKSLQALSECNFDYTYTRKVNKKEQTVRASGGILTLEQIIRSTDSRDEIGYWQNGRARVTFTLNFIMFMSNDGYKPMPFFTELMLINPKKNPYSLDMGFKLFYYKFLSEVKRQHRDIISVKSLLEVCDINLAARAKTRRVIDPFERDLDELCALNILAAWEYCNSKGKPLTDEQLNDAKSFDTFKTLYIKFAFSSYPKFERKNRVHTVKCCKVEESRTE